MRAISNGLFSVLATLGAMPIIRAPPQGPSEMVARQLSDLVSQAWAGGSGPFADQAGSAVATRPLVIILDRALDFSTALAHTCTYQALVDDVLDFKMNRVTVSDGSAQGKAYDLEVEQDSFWKKNAPRAFPEAIDDNSQELTRIKELEKEIKDKTAGSSEAAAEASTAEVLAAENQGGGTQELLATVDSLPKLLEVMLLLLRILILLFVHTGCVSYRHSIKRAHCFSVCFFSIFLFVPTAQEKARVTHEYIASDHEVHRGEGASGLLRSRNLRPTRQREAGGAAGVFEQGHFERQAAVAGGAHSPGRRWTGEGQARE